MKALKVFAVALVGLFIYGSASAQVTSFETLSPC
jgi:hypothetical protein